MRALEGWVKEKVSYDCVKAQEKQMILIIIKHMTDNDLFS
jgi:hypothetical protein